MAQIGSAGSQLNIRLGQVPVTTRPDLRGEMQQVYNALHILNAYTNKISAELGGDIDATPADSLKFVRSYETTALQSITAGSIVSPYGSGVVKGVLRTGAPNSFTAHPSFVGPWGRKVVGGLQIITCALAMTDAAAGEVVRIGVGPGIIELAGAKCGALIWAADNRWISSRKGTTNGDNPSTEYITGQSLTEDGQMYLSNNVFTERIQDISTKHEGISAPGYPYMSGTRVMKKRKFLFPVGIAIANNYVYFFDHVMDGIYDTIGIVV